MMSKRLGEWKVINADELYRQVINEGHRRKISILEGKNKQSDEEIIEDMRKANAIEEFISLFVPGINAFTDAYQLRCENGYIEEGKLGEKKDSLKFVSDVTKGKGRAINLKMNLETYSSVYEPYVDIDTTDVDTVEIDTVVADSVITDYEDSLPSIEDRGVLCKAQNIIDVKMDKNTWLEKYENTVIINYPNSVGTIYKVVRRRDD